MIPNGIGDSVEEPNEGKYSSQAQELEVMRIYNRLECHDGFV